MVVALAGSLPTVNVAEWQQQLNQTFLSDSASHEALLWVLGAEAEHEQDALANISGHFSLLHSLQAFLLKTVSLTGTHRNSPHLKGRLSYSPFLFDFVMCFRTIRACENVMLRGYPFHGYMLLRGIKEQVLFLAAIGQRMTSLTALSGLRPNMTADEVQAEAHLILKRKSAEEKRVLHAVLRQATDLASHREALMRWERGFNMEVHGQLYSGSHLFLKWIKGGELPLTPKYDIDFGSIYLNRLGDIGWMLMRLFPLLQPAPAAFGSMWASRWAVLDDSFRRYNDGLKSIGKPGLSEIADGVEALVDKRFAFLPDSSSYQDCLET